MVQWLSSLLVIGTSRCDSDEGHGKLPTFLSHVLVL